MQLSRGVARFNKRVTNRVQGLWAWLLPPWAVMVHRGRRSGTRYTTPVIAFRAARGIAVPLLYGEQSDWVRNLLVAGGGEVKRCGRTYRLDTPRVVDADEVVLGRLAGRYVRAAPRCLVATVAARAR